MAVEKSVTDKNGVLEKYTVIDNCPKCRGALLFVENLLGGKVIRCLQCGCEFKECERERKGRNGNGVVMYVKPLFRFKSNGGQDENAGLKRNVFSVPQKIFVTQLAKSRKR